MRSVLSIDQELDRRKRHCDAQLLLACEQSYRRGTVGRNHVAASVTAIQ